MQTGHGVLPFKTYGQTAAQDNSNKLSHHTAPHNKQKPINYLALCAF